VVTRTGRSDESLATAAVASIIVQRLTAFARWVGAGRKLTQTGRITLADARVLVDLLQTGDELDPTIGDRALRTKSSEELLGLNLVVEWAKAARLVRATKGRLVPVKKSLSLLDSPLELWDRAFDAFPALGPALYPSGHWLEPLLQRELEPVVTALLSRLYGGALRVDDASELSWEIASDRYVFGDGSEEPRERWRRWNDRDTELALQTLGQLGAVEFVVADEQRMVTLTSLGLRGVRRFLGESGPGEPVLQVKVTLEDVTGPPVWRRLQVSAGVRLDRLHSILQAAMGWTDSHLHLFAAGGHEYSDPAFELETESQDESKVRLADLVVREGDTIEYTYDFGDDWRHKVVVEKLLVADQNFRYPICVTGEGACPPEDCGGAPGYQYLREALADTNHPEHDEFRVWLGLDDGAEFDPRRFDLGQVNRALREIGVERRT
jgi:hypothetical protein